MMRALGILTLVALTGCGGGGGGSGAGTSSTLAPFVNWDTSLKPNQSFQVSGVSLETNVVTDPATKFFLSASDPVERSVTVTGTLNSKADGLSKFGFTSTSGRSLTFSSGIIKQDGNFIAESLDLNESLSLIDPTDVEWKYQSLGGWVNASPNFSISTQGYFSVGSVTPSSAIPIRNTATYTGVGYGTVLSAGVATESFESSIRGQVDFTARSVTLTSVVLIGSTLGNFSGVLSYGPGASAFSGAVANSNSSLTGSASGRFYGPEAQEIGGLFSLSGSSGAQRVFGAFGASR